MGRELAHQRRPIEQRPIRMEIRIANSGPIRRDDPHPKLPRRIMSQLRHRARAGPTVTEEDRCAVRISVLGEGQLRSALELKNPGLGLHK